MKSSSRALPVILGVLTLAPAASADWPQLGGRDRDFNVGGVRLADTWPAGGPERLWRRDLGEGYSGLAVVDQTIYTLYRRGGDEVVVALGATGGKTLWEHAYPAPEVEGLNLEYGPGPHSTPLVVGPRVFAVGATAKLHALERAHGKVVWQHDLWDEFETATLLDRGYSCSPIAYAETVIVTVGGAGQAVVAFDQSTGRMVWQAQNFASSPSSPILIDVDGADQLVVFMAGEVAGLDPANGKLLWSHRHRTRWGLNISLPIWTAGNVLVVSSAYDGGSRALKLERNGEKTQVRELWSHSQMRLHFTSGVRMGHYFLGSSGNSGPIPLAAVRVADGEVVWRSRDIGRANLVRVGDKILALDEAGQLLMARVSDEGLDVLSKTRLDALSRPVWTAPTVEGNRLYVRDRKVLAAFALP